VPDIDQLMRQGLISPDALDRFGGQSSAMDATGYQSKGWDAYGNTMGDITQSAAKLGNSWWMTALESGATRLDHLKSGIQAGKSYPQIAQEIGASVPSTAEKANALGLRSSAQGGAAPRIWSDTENAAIRQAISDRVPTRQLAVQMGTSQGSIARQINALGLRGEASGVAPVKRSNAVTLPRLKFMDRPMVDD
jgi:hypothetical protein